MRRDIHWKCLFCGRHLATIKVASENELVQTSKCHSCKSLNTLEVSKNTIVCTGEESMKPRQTKIR